MKSQGISILPKVIVRTPLLEWDDLESFFRCINNEQVAEKLRSTFSDPLIQEALFIASAELHRNLLLWLDYKLVNKKDEQKLLLSLTKYFLRMCSRCTPFGIFANLSVGSWDNASSFIFAAKQQIVKKTSIDFEYIYSIKDSILKTNLNTIRKLKLYTNTSIYQVGTQYKFIDSFFNSHVRTLGISRASHTEYLERVVNEARNGIYLHPLLELLKNFGVNKTEASKYIHLLLEKQILVTELEPTLIEGNYFDKLLDILTERKISKHAKAFLKVKNVLKELDSKIGCDISEYDSLRFENDVYNVQVKNVFQVDSFRPTIHSTLDNNIAKSIAKGIEILNKLSRKSKDTDIDVFKRKFIEKYQDQYVPIMEALDYEIGINYSSASTYDNTPLLKQLNFHQSSSVMKLEWDEIDRFLLRKLLDANQFHKSEVCLTGDDLKRFESNWQHVPFTFSVLVSAVNLDDRVGDFINVLGAAGSSAVNLISRFTHLDASIGKLADEIIEKEVSQEHITAEILYVPDYTRAGNILQKRFERSYEIPFLTIPSSNQSKKIYLDDILVRVVDNRFELKSKSLDKNIVIKSCSPYNHRLGTHPVFHFLGDLQYQGLRWPLIFDWGPLQSDYTFLPRVRYENIVLSPATWFFTVKDFEHIVNEENDRISNIQNFCLKWKLPDLIAVAANDNHLPLDLSSIHGIEVLYSILKKGQNVKIIECYRPQHLFKNDTEDKRYSNEVLCLFKKDAKDAVTVKQPLSENKKDEVIRSFMPGSEWVYFKIYTGTNGADLLVKELFSKLSDKLIQSNLVDKWFFIRYSDPNYHLRVRFHLKDIQRFQEVILLFNDYLSPYVSNKIIAKVQLDSYERELERYGSDLIELAESIFFIDSLFVSHAIKYIGGCKKPEEVRWLFALKSVDGLLNDFNYELDDKIRLISYLDKNYRNRNLAEGLNKKQRDLREKIISVIEEREKDEIWTTLYQLIKLRSKQNNALLASDIRENLKTNNVNFMASSIHMLINRLCLSRPNHHEAVFYDFLYKYYKSCRAQSMTKKKSVIL